VTDSSGTLRSEEEEEKEEEVLQITEQTFTEVYGGPHVRADGYFPKNFSLWASPCQSRQVRKGRSGRKNPLCTYYNPSNPPVLLGKGRAVWNEKVKRAWEKG